MDLGLQLKEYTAYKKIDLNFVVCLFRSLFGYGCVIVNIVGHCPTFMVGA